MFSGDQPSWSNWHAFHRRAGVWRLPWRLAESTFRHRRACQARDLFPGKGSVTMHDVAAVSASGANGPGPAEGNPRRRLALRPWMPSRMPAAARPRQSPSPHPPRPENMSMDGLVDERTRSGTPAEPAGAQADGLLVPASRSARHRRLTCAPGRTGFIRPLFIQSCRSGEDLVDTPHPAYHRA